MEEKHFYDITEVCKKLGTTSRTLRFYEEKGIITSTTTGFSARRQYTEEQVAHIQNVLVLRKLGFSVREIAALQAETTDLKDAVLSKRAGIYASINARIQEIHFLNNALLALESGKNIFDTDWQMCPQANPEEMEIANRCTQAILNQEDDLLYKYLSPRLAQYMPKDVYKAVRKDIFTSLGDLVALTEIVADEKCPNKLYSKVQYSNLGLLITFVFYDGLIGGLWLEYYEP